MRTRLSPSLAVFAVGLAIALPAVGDAQPASAALVPVVGCGFHFGAISEQGAAGTLFFSVVLEPANAAQRCTTAITFTMSAAPTNPAAGPYTTIQENPLSATQTVTFAPGRLPPRLTTSWAAFHCADPPVPGSLRFASGGQSTSTPITPTTCAGMGESRFASDPIPAAPSAVGIAPTANDQGYRMVSRTGALTHEGNATAFTAASSVSPVVGVASPRTGNGAWVAAANGGVFAYGTAGFHGSLGAVHLNAPIVGMAATPDGHGYFLTASDGGVFAFGSATYAGSLGSVLLNAPIVGIAAGPHGGYWLAGSDGSVFAFGGVPFKGSLGAFHLALPTSGMAATASGNGYWLVGTDNRVYGFGDAHPFGDAPIQYP